MAHRLTLEDTFGREVATITNVPHTELRKAFDKLCDAARSACPVIFVDGKGYTSRAEFLAMVSAVNSHSMSCGGAQVY